MIQFRNALKILSLSALICVISTASNANETADDFLNEKEDDFPGCVQVVRNQLSTLPEKQHVSMTPYLFEVCVSGRSIGEKRTKQMYDIPKSKKPKKTNGFSIKIEPPKSLNTPPYEVQY